MRVEYALGICYARQMPFWHAVQTKLPQFSSVETSAAGFDEFGSCLTINFREAIYDFIDLSDVTTFVCKYVDRINAIVPYSMTQMEPFVYKLDQLRPY